MERLSKAIAQAGVCSRRKAEELITSGSVRVNNEVITTLGYKVVETDHIKVNGKAIKRQRHEYYLLYKPKNVISTTNDDKQRESVVDYIKSSVRLYPVGRLDFDTTGIIILTNDGNFANKVMHPSSKLFKTYLVYVDGLITSRQIAMLEKGIKIDEYTTKPAKAKIVSKDVKHNNCVIRLSISEGKNHQVKKMIASLGLSVRKLHREKYGHLDLKGMIPGQYRKVSNKERDQLIELANNGYLDY